MSDGESDDVPRKRVSRKHRNRIALSSESEEEESKNAKNNHNRRGRPATGAGTRDELKRGVRGTGMTQNNADDEDDDYNLTQNAGNSPKEMASQGVFFLLIAHSKKTPIKRAELTKSVLKIGHVKPTLYKEIIQKVQKLLKGVFGIQLYGLNESTHQVSLDLTSVGLTSYMLISNFQPIKLPAKITMSTTTKYEDAVQAVLFLSLSVMFMTSVDLSAGIKEEVIWRVVSGLDIQTELGVKEQDFTKFLKTELVQKQYLLSEEIKDDGTNLATFRYSWGPRAHLEYQKASILVKVAEFMNVRPQDFPEQYKAILNSPEGSLAKKAFAKFLYQGLVSGVVDGTTGEDGVEQEEDLDTQPIDGDLSLTRISQLDPDMTPDSPGDTVGSALPSQNGSTLSSDEED